MSMFFDNHVLLDGEQSVMQAWSNNEFNMILAIATTMPRIIFVSEEGQVVPQFEISKNKTAVQQMCWHPSNQALAVGYQDGNLLLWHEDERLSRDDKSVHKSAITNLVFSPDGSRLVTGDIKGVVSVWRTTRNLTPICQYSRDGAIHQIVFCSLALNAPGVQAGDKTQNPTGNVNSMFFFGGQNGSVCLADDLKNCSEVCKVPGSVKSILFYEKENSVIIITSHLLLVQFKLNLAEKLVPDRKVKLAVAGNPEYLSTIWAGQGLMATVSGENMIRMFNIASDENYVLTLAEPAFQSAGLFQDKINTIHYNPKNRILTGGTKNGYIVMWKCKSLSASSPDSSDGWEARSPMKCQGPGVLSIKWGGNQSVLSAIYASGATILNHTVLKKKMKNNFRAIQINNKSVEVRIRNDNAANSDFQILMTLGMNIRGIDCCGQHTLFWNGKFCQVYDVQGAKGPALLGNFESRATVCALTNESIVQATEGNRLEVTSYTGEVKQVLPLSEQEGDVLRIDARGKYMVVVTNKSIIKLFDISRRTYKQVGVSRKFEFKAGEPIGEIKDVALNADGKKLAIISDQTPFPNVRIPDPSFYVYDIDMDKFLDFKLPANRVPVEASWDQDDARLLAVEAEYAQLDSDSGLDADAKTFGDVKVQDLDDDVGKKTFTGKTIETYFVTTDYGIKSQDQIKFEETDETLLGVQVPHFYFMGHKERPQGEDSDDENSRKQQEDANNMIIIRKPMKDFVGLENVEEGIRKAIMNFSHYLTVGNMDEAYNSVRNIRNNTVWQNMAQMCVKTKRMDVAQVCLGNMRFARGARAARESEGEKELEARLAMVAIQLNMIDDAKSLYKESGRYDLLGKLHQACGEWDDALNTAQKFNRINLKSTHYAMAQHHESTGDIDLAIKHYIESNTHQTEVPRMLTQLNMPERLQDFVMARREPALFKWWAQYLEGQGLSKEALSMYKEAQDFGSVVRMFCAVGDVQNATKVAMNSADAHACYTLGRYFEAEGNISEAIVYYSKSQRLHHAIRLAKEHGYDQQVLTMSLISSKQIQIQSAHYFEQKGKFDKSVQLYSRGGNKRRAMELAMAHNLGHMIEDVASGVDDNDDPEVLKSSVSFMMQNQQYEKAVEIMIGLGQTSEALDISEQYNVELKEESALKLIPPAADNANQKAVRQEILLRVAKLVKKQGQFKLGAKIYTMANEKMKGIKCLLKSGDVKAIKGFAQNARQAEVYVLAGNFLQNQNWHNDPDIMKTIISFYQRAKAFESLANFYDACAQVEIDEYRDYEKALGAMKEAKRQLDMSNAANKQTKQQMLEKRIDQLARFCEARELLNAGNGEGSAQICDELISQPGVEEAIRLGDVFAQLIEYQMNKQQNVEKAYEYLEKMQKKKIIVTPYLDAALIEKIYRGMGLPMPNERQNNQGFGDNIEEDIPEDF